MAITKPRNRTLIFRLTQEEYQALQTASSGARSLSDYARTRLLGTLDSQPTPAQLGAELNELKTSVSLIYQLLEKR